MAVSGQSSGKFGATITKGTGKDPRAAAAEALASASDPARSQIVRSAQSSTLIPSVTGPIPARPRSTTLPAVPAAAINAPWTTQRPATSRVAKFVVLGVVIAAILVGGAFVLVQTQQAAEQAEQNYNKNTAETALLAQIANMQVKIDEMQKQLADQKKETTNLKNEYHNVLTQMDYINRRQH
jgi:uncharacterized protein HemX